MIWKKDKNDYSKFMWSSVKCTVMSLNLKKKLNKFTDKLMTVHFTCKCITNVGLKYACECSSFD